MRLSFSKLLTLHMKEKWRLLTPFTRKLSATLLTYGFCCFMIFAVCLTAVLHEAKYAEMFLFLSLGSLLLSTAFFSSAFLSEAAGEVIIRIKHHRRLSTAIPKYIKRLSAARIPIICGASYRAGNARIRRTTRSHVSSNSLNTSDGEPDAGEGDPPAPPYLFSSLLVSYLTFIHIFCKKYNYSLQWLFLENHRCWCILSDLLSQKGGGSRD